MTTISSIDTISSGIISSGKVLADKISSGKLLSDTIPLGKISLKSEPLSLRLEKRDPSFAERLNAAVKDVNSNQNLADEATTGVLKGEVGIHEGMLALGKADTSLRLLMQVKSKAMEAYKEIINMQL